MDVLTEHDRDFVGWTERQAAILRSLPPGTHGLDTVELAEEVEDLGRTEIRAASSLLRQVLIHLIKLVAEPDALSAAHWRGEIVTFQADAVAAASSGVRQRIDLRKVWNTARKAAEDELGTKAAGLDLPVDCPFDLAELLADDFESSRLIDQLRHRPRDGNATLI